MSLIFIFKYIKDSIQIFINILKNNNSLRLFKPMTIKEKKLNKTIFNSI